jgi:hypothetical protein
LGLRVAFSPADQSGGGKLDEPPPNWSVNFPCKNVGPPTGAGVAAALMILTAPTDVGPPPGGRLTGGTGDGGSVVGGPVVGGGLLTGGPCDGGVVPGGAGEGGSVTGGEVIGGMVVTGGVWVGGLLTGGTGDGGSVPTGGVVPVESGSKPRVTVPVACMFLNEPVPLTMVYRSEFESAGVG